MTYVSTIKNGLLVLATSSASDTVFAFNGDTGKAISTFHVGDTPKGVKIRPDANFAFVANEGSDSVTVINLILGKIHTEIPVGKSPHNIIFHPTKDLAFVTLQGEDKVAIIDTKRFEMMSSIPLEGLPHNLDISPDGKLLYVTSIAKNDVVVINLESQQIMARIPVSNGHHGIDVSPDGNRVYVSGIGGKNYVDEKLFENNQVELVYQNYHFKEYPQRFSKSFSPNLSILDLLFNVGPDSLKLIQANNLEKPFETVERKLTIAKKMKYTMISQDQGKLGTT